ncbi:VWA domain-containing protein [Nocardia sp. NPDC058058]|uniref:vWA domain-containing protein n=1 Tax=Nocardia sp. NPDC058058 TaxID=3346317 RepID=UPI0036D77806
MVRKSAHSASIEPPPVLPICLVLDVSGSMYGPPIDAVNQMMPTLRRTLLADPSARAMARLSLIAFESSAHIALPLTDLYRARIPFLQAGGATNFRDAFRQTRTAIEQGIRLQHSSSRILRPVVYFLSDGADFDTDWRPAWEQLVGRADAEAVDLVSFGLGAADRAAIGAISTRYAFTAESTDATVAIRDIFTAISESIIVTSESFDGTARALSAPTTAGLIPLPVRTRA